MATSPSKPAPHLSPPADPANAAHLSSPRSTRTLRKLQSAQTLSSNYSAQGNFPSLISQQRQLQHRSSAILRDIGPPPVPIISAAPDGPSRNRIRANSEVAARGMTNDVEGRKRTAMAKKMGKDDNMDWKDEIDVLLRSGPQGDVPGNLAWLRKSVLCDGLVADTDGMSQFRIYIWLILLDAPPLQTDHYLALIHRGPSPAYAKIRNDTFRTLATDPLFKRRVSEASIIRLLNALAWTLHDNQYPPSRSPKPSTTTSATGSPSKVNPQSTLSNHTPEIGSNPPSAPCIYLQGMNVLSAPFLYAARSEAEAYILTRHLVTVHLPSYIRPTMTGVHRGASLLDRILAIVDPKVASHLSSASLSAEIYAFPSLLTLCACTPPLPEVLYLWDFLFAYGVHLNVLAVVAQLFGMRDEILSTSRPGGMLRSFPPLKAKTVVGLVLSFVKVIPRDLYEELVAHVR